MYASQFGHLDCMKYLINEGAIVSQVENVFKYTLCYFTRIELYILQDGMTPLLYASKNGHLECIEYLISVGASDTSEIDKVVLCSII